MCLSLCFRDCVCLSRVMLLFSVCVRFLSHLPQPPAVLQHMQTGEGDVDVGAAPQQLSLLSTVVQPCRSYCYVCDTGNSLHDVMYYFVLIDETIEEVQSKIRADRMPLRGKV